MPIEHHPDSTDRFDRLRLLAGDAAVTRLDGRHVAVFGLGGVGSHAVEALARAAIGELTLVDFDRISPSNINRQSHACDQTVGRYKAEVLAERCRAIHPALRLHVHLERYSPATAPQLLAPPYDMVLDCIDQIGAKIDLICHCRQAGIPLMSALGAGNKTDPAQVCLGDLFASRHCRLARVLRKELRRRGVSGPLPAVYSTELPRQRSGGRDAAGAKAALGSISTIPALFGLMLAGQLLHQWLAPADS